MSITLGTIGAMAGLGLLNAGVDAAMTQWNMDYNAEEADKNRYFQKYMRDSTISSIMKQAEENGISPSLLLGSGSTQLGGSQASVGTQHGGMSSGVNQIMNYIREENRLDKMEEIEENRLEAKTKIAEERNETLRELQRMRSSTNNREAFHSRKYTEKELNDLFDDLDKINL